MPRPIYEATILGDSPAWARKARDCMRRHFTRRGVLARVMADKANVRIVILRQSGLAAWEDGVSAMRRAEKACGI